MKKKAPLGKTRFIFYLNFILLENKMIEMFTEFHLCERRKLICNDVFPTGVKILLVNNTYHNMY
jgi:hypothetical protein